MDKEFIEKCKKGDTGALECLYNSFAPKMKAICLRYAQTTFEAEDIFQEAFIKVLLNLKNYNFTGSIYGWIKTIVVNTAIDHLDKDKMFRNQLSTEEIDESEFESLDIIDTLFADDLLEIIKKIPPGYKLIFNLHAIEGYSHAEIANMLNIGESTSRSQLAKARNYIKSILLSYDFGRDRVYKETEFKDRE